MLQTIKATAVVAIFALVALYALPNAPRTPELLPHILFFVTLLLNTFYSIRFYAAIQPNDIGQAVIDILLVAAYVALAVSLGEPLAFVVNAFLIFILAPIKYILMLGKIPHMALLLRKIKIDATGTALCALWLAAASAGFTLASAWMAAVLFIGANIYFLWIKPMYTMGDAR